MKNILIIIGLLLSITGFSQIDTVNNGSYAGSGDGETLHSAFQKVNEVIKVVNSNIPPIDSTWKSIKSDTTKTGYITWDNIIIDADSSNANSDLYLIDENYIYKTNYLLTKEDTFAWKSDLDGLESYNRDSVYDYEIDSSLARQSDIEDSLNNLTVSPSMIDLSLAPDGALLHESGDSASYSGKLIVNSNTLKITSTLSDTGIYINPASSSTGILVDIGSGIGNKGIEINVPVLGGEGIVINNAGGTAFKIIPSGGATELINVSTVSGDNALTVYDDSVTTDLPTTIHNKLTVDSFQVGDGAVITTSDFFDLSAAPAGAVLVEMNDTIGYDGNFTWNGSTLKLIDSRNDIFIGSSAGNSSVTGSNNIGIGINSMTSLTSGTSNVGLGLSSGLSVTTGVSNTLIGDRAGFTTQSGDSNTFVGYWSARLNNVGSNNTYLGNKAGELSTGSNNVFIGNNAGLNETGSNKLYIDNSSTTTPLIYGEFDNDSLVINGNLTVTDGLSINGGDVLTSSDTIDLKTAVNGEVFDSITTDKLILPNYTNLENEYQLYLNPATGEVTAAEVTHGYLYFQDSVITVNLVDDVWSEVTNATDSIFIVVENEHFDYILGDTIQINTTGHLKWFPELDFYGDAGENFEMEIYNTTQDYSVPKRKYNEGSGATDRASMNGMCYDINCISGDKYIMRWRNIDGGDPNAELLGASIYLEITHAE